MGFLAHGDTSRRRWSRGSLIGLAALALVACGERNEDAANTATRGPDLATIEVGVRPVTGEMLFDGVVEAVEQAALSAQTSGRVVDTPVDVDDAVRKGQLLLRLRATEQVAGLGQAKAAVAAAVAREAQARAQFERIADMYQRKVVARTTYDEAIVARDAAAAGLAAARAALEAAREGVAYTELRAPFDGVVTARHVQSGEAVAPGTPLLAISGGGPRRVTAAVPQALAEQVRAKSQATVHLPGGPLPAARVTVFPVADARTGTVRVRADLPANAPAPAPGTHVKLGFATGEQARMTVPRTAVFARSELRAVYVVLPDGRVTLRQVRLGRTVGDEVEIVAGLAAGERVALDPSRAVEHVGGPAPAPTDE